MTGRHPEPADRPDGADQRADTARTAARTVIQAGTHPGGQPVWIRLADEAEARAWARCAPADGPLAGTVFAVKDNIDVVGHPTTAACPTLATTPATDSAPAVARLVAAGAVPVGKTNMDQFATGLTGTRSPYGTCHSVTSPAHVSGGSSSGSAVAVASGLVPLALGTDTAGSGRVPAAFNGIVGLKPTRGLIPTRGVLPACRSLDCVSTFTRTVGAARTALETLAGFDQADPWSRAPAGDARPAGVAAQMRVIGVPAGALDLDDVHRQAWQAALDHARKVAAHLVEVDIEPFLETARLLYQGPWIAERWASFGRHLEPDGAHLDPHVRRIVAAGRDVTGAEVFDGLEHLAVLRRRSEGTWPDLDALLLPVTPGHPTLAQVAADPIGVNARLGTYTNFVNLLDLCAIAVPAGRRADGLPFGVQLVAPAFADAPLLDLAAAWCGEDVPATPAPPGTTLLAVAGAHLSGLPLNPQLLALGATLAFRARTAGGYRLYRLPGTGVPRPGLVRTGDGPESGIAVEVWQVDHRAIGALADAVPAPLGIGRIALDDGQVVAGFLAEPHGVRDAEDVTAHGGWRPYLAGLA